MMLTEFLTSLAKESGIAFVSYLTAYFSTSCLLLNSPHGSQSAWETTMRQVKAVVDGRSTLVSGSLELAIPCPSVDSILEIEKALSVIKGAENSIKRLLIIRTRWRMLLFGLLISFSVGFVSAAPVLAGGSPVTEAGPWVYTLCLGLESGLFIAVFNWRQAACWTELQDFTQRLQDKMGPKNGWQALEKLASRPPSGRQVVH